MYPTDLTAQSLSQQAMTFDHNFLAFPLLYFSLSFQMKSLKIQLCKFKVICLSILYVF